MRRDAPHRADRRGRRPLAAPLSSRDSPPHATRQSRGYPGEIVLRIFTCTSIAASTLPSANTGIAMQWFPISSSPDDTATCAWRIVLRLWRNFSGATMVYRVNCVRPFTRRPSVIRVGENASRTLPRAVACAGSVAATSKLVTG